MKLYPYLKEHQISIQTLSSLSHLPYSTVRDLVTEKTSIAKSSFQAICKLADALQLPINTFRDNEDYPSFASNTGHELKAKGDMAFLHDVLSEDRVTQYIRDGKYVYALYTLALIDYLCHVNNIEIPNRYNKYRGLRLYKPIYPNAQYFHELPKAYQNDVIKNAIPEFVRYNIYEGDIRNVV